jgi:catechol 2,3-dioxygenase-like lactoylglutathione lyase family enzyme
MRIRLTSVPVEDQSHALSFYTEILGFEKKVDLPLGEYRWLTVVSKEEPDAAQLLLEPIGHPAAKTYQTALREDGIPVVSFEVDDIDAEHSRLTALQVEFTSGPASAGDTKVAVFKDTCGNLVQIYETPGG